MGRYSRLMVKHPFVLIVVDVVLAFVLGPLTVWIFGLPDFSDPTKGYEPRGSKINTWEMVAKNIYYQLYRDHLLMTKPENYSFTKTPEVNQTTPMRKKRFTASSVTDLQICAAKVLSRVNKVDGRIIVESKTGANIFTANHLHSICQIQDQISSYPWKGKSCYMPSLPLFVTALAGKKSCYDVTDKDVGNVLQLLKRCSGYYFSGFLKPYCEEQKTCPAVPKDCTAMNAVYTILDALTDSGFLANGNSSLTHVDFSILVLPRFWYQDSTSELVKYFMQNVEGKVIEDGDIFVPAMYLNIHRAIFSVYVKADIAYYAMAMAMVVIVLLLYLQSFVLMIAVVANVIITLCLSFFVYYYIIQLQFFPFINLIAALLLIAISADDVFIIYDLWRQQIRTNPDSSYEEIMSETLRKGGLSIFVTSLTTAASLLANVASQITTVRCFGVFAGICILINFILMITWIPALIILIEKTFTYCIPNDAYGGVRRCFQRMTKVSDYFWGVIMMKIITIGSPIWVIGLLLVGGLGLIAVFLTPGLKLPQDNFVKVFNPEHPLERYQQEYKDRIRFEQQFWKADTIHIQYIWGVKGVDNGDLLDPNKLATLEFAPLNLYTREVIDWQVEFCRQLKNQSFFGEANPGVCYFEALQELISGSCVKANGSYNLTPCCNMTSLPDSANLKMCMTFYAQLSNGSLDRIYGSKTFGDVIFDQENDIKIFRYHFYTNTIWGPNHARMEVFMEQIENFTEARMANAPDTMDEGGFASFGGFQLIFYDLQNAIFYGTMTGIGLSITCSFLVLLATSLNIVISLFAIVTIALIIGATVGTLVLLGWELNVTESLTITMSLGLAVDFTIHYGVAYILVKSNSRHQRVKETVTTVSSAISMAALTTFVSGASVLGSRVLAYRQFGLFLVFVMCYSWVFSTFLFLPLCYGIGPLGHTGDIGYLFRCCCPGRGDKTRNKPNVQANGLNKPSDSNGRLPSVYDREQASLGLSKSVIVHRPNSSVLMPFSPIGGVSSDHRASNESVARSSPAHSRPQSGSGDPASHRARIRKQWHRPDFKEHASPRNSPANSRMSSRLGLNRDDEGSSHSSRGSHADSSRTFLYDVHVYRVGDKGPSQVKRVQVERTQNGHHSQIRVVNN